MDELIRKQTVLNMIDDVQFGNITHKLSQLHEAVRNLPSAQQWIPCSERLPENDETVLVTRDNGIIEKATFEVGEVNNGWWMDFWYSEDNVKAWMPLPEPYRKEATDG